MDSIGQNGQINHSWNLRSTAESAQVSGGKVSAETPLGELKPGQQFTGEITNITAEEVEILMDNRQTLHARLGEQMELSIGQRMTFAVKDSANGQITIQPAPSALTTGAYNPAAEKALAANGFAPSQRNLQIASALLDAGLPLGKESMRGIMQESVRYPDAPIQTLVDMNKLGIPVTESNIRQFTAYQAHEHQFSAQINTTIETASQAVTNLMNHVSGTEAGDVVRELVSVFGWDKVSSFGSGNSGEASVGQVQTQAFLQGDAGSVGTIETLATENAEVKTAATGAEEGQGGVVISESGQTDAKGEALSTAASQGEVYTDQAAPTATAGETMGTAALTGKEDIKSGATWTASPEALAVAEELDKQGVDPDVVRTLNQETKTAGEWIAKFQAYAREQGDEFQRIAHQVYKSDAFRNILGKGMEEQWLMKPEEMKEPKEIDTLLNRIQEQDKGLTDLLQQHGGSDQRHGESSNNMRENLMFMQQLNEQFVYAQVPMKLNGEAANSELFVYANKKKLMQQEDGVKVLLHLDMPNLGPTDILVRLKNKQLHATFTMEDQESVEIVADNMESLAKVLESKGFAYSNEVRQAEPKENKQAEEKTDAVIDAMFDQDLVTGQKRYTFDMRG